MRKHSPYNYAFNNPVYFIDPDGMKGVGWGKTEENQWVYQKGMKEGDATYTEMGYIEFKEDGSFIEGRINDGEVGTIRLGENGLANYVENGSIYEISTALKYLSFKIGQTFSKIFKDSGSETFPGFYTTDGSGRKESFERPSWFRFGKDKIDDQDWGSWIKPGTGGPSKLFGESFKNFADGISNAIDAYRTFVPDPNEKIWIKKDTVILMQSGTSKATVSYPITREVLKKDSVEYSRRMDKHAAFIRSLVK